MDGRAASLAGCLQLNRLLLPRPALPRARCVLQLLQTVLTGTTGQVILQKGVKGALWVRTTSGNHARVTKKGIEAGVAAIHVINAVLLPGNRTLKASSWPRWLKEISMARGPGPTEWG